MRIKYPQAIQESEEELTKLEQHLRGQKTADRVRALRLLKSGAVKSLRVLCAAGRLQCDPADPKVGNVTGQRARPRLLKQHKPTGKASRLTSEAWAGLMQAMRAGRIATMQEARNYLEREWGIRYKNGKSLWWLFKKHRVKCKTGRRRHKKANAEQQAALKKTSAAWSSNHGSSGSWPWMKAALA
jgi:transposase